MKEPNEVSRVFFPSFPLRPIVAFTLPTARLDSRPLFFQAELPNYRRRSRSLCHAPHDKKSGFSCFCHYSTSLGVGYKLAEQRPGNREVPAAFDKPGSVVPPFCF